LALDGVFSLARGQFCQSAMDRQTSVQGLNRLSIYWFRAELMHEFLHIVLREFDNDFSKIASEGYWPEFEAYLSYWLSGLFVVVEGFNKLRLKDSRVQKLFREHLAYLKAMRHETYHFSIAKGPKASEVLRHMNWAEELHEVVGEYIRERLERSWHAEKIMELRRKH
jgi:hypothetical protein